MNTKEFSLLVERKAISNNGSLLETIIEVQEEKGMDISQIVPLLNKSVVEKLKVEGIKASLLIP